MPEPGFPASSIAWEIFPNNDSVLSIVAQDTVLSYELPADPTTLEFLTELLEFLGDALCSPDIIASMFLLTPYGVNAPWIAHASNYYVQLSNGITILEVDGKPLIQALLEGVKVFETQLKSSYSMTPKEI